MARVPAAYHAGRQAWAPALVRVVRTQARGMGHVG